MENSTTDTFIYTFDYAACYRHMLKHNLGFCFTSIGLVDRETCEKKIQKSQAQL